MTSSKNGRFGVEGGVGGDARSERATGRRAFLRVVGAAAVAGLAGVVAPTAVASHDGVDLRSALTAGTGRWYQEEYMTVPFGPGNAGRTDALWTFRPDGSGSLQTELFSNSVGGVVAAPIRSSIITGNLGGQFLWQLDGHVLTMQVDTWLGTPRVQQAELVYDGTRETIRYTPSAEQANAGVRAGEWVPFDRQLSDGFGVGDYDAYQQLTDATGSFGFEVPTAWGDVYADSDRQTWSGVAAAPSLDAFGNGTGSGLMVVAVFGYGTVPIEAFLDETDAPGCTLIEQRGVRTSNGFSGGERLYTACGGNTSVVVYSVLRDPQNVLTFFVTQVLADQRDMAAAARFQDTLFTSF